MLLGQPRVPTDVTFLPVGHIAFDTHAADYAQNINLDIPKSDSYWIKSLYVSYTLQGLGIGGATMNVAEHMAAQEPLNARHLLLDTVHHEDQSDKEWAAANYGGEFKVELANTVVSYDDNADHRLRYLPRRGTRGADTGWLVQSKTCTTIRMHKGRYGLPEQFSSRKTSASGVCHFAISLSAMVRQFSQRYDRFSQGLRQHLGLSVTVMMRLSCYPDIKALD